jgi:hypothetical protein
LLNSRLALESPQVLSLLSPSHQNSFLALNSSQQMSPSPLPLLSLMNWMMMKQTQSM